MQGIDVSAQIVTFLLSMALGAVLCLFYDILRVLHMTSVNGFVEVIVSDLIFWLVAAMATYCFLLIRCLGQIRFYVLFGILVGFLAVHFTVSSVFMKIMRFVFNAISAVLGFIRKTALLIFSPIIRFLKKLSFKVKKFLQDKAGLLYNCFGSLFVK